MSSRTSVLHQSKFFHDIKFVNSPSRHFGVRSNQRLYGHHSIFIFVFTCDPQFVKRRSGLSPTPNFNDQFSKLLISIVNINTKLKNYNRRSRADRQTDSQTYQKQFATACPARREPASARASARKSAPTSSYKNVFLLEKKVAIIVSNFLISLN